MRGPHAVLLAVLLVACLSAPAAAQRSAAAPRALAAPGGAAAAAVPAAPEEVPPVSPIFLASAVVPGSAQWLMGQDRWVPYVATELWAVVSYVQQRRSARDLEQRYRDLAWQVARRPDRPEVRRDSVFEYYEAMSYYTASGAWMPNGQPESRPGTYNGEMWKLARSLYLPGGVDAPEGSPAWEAAIAYYKSRAIPPGYGWAWGAANLEQQVFADLITESDAAFRAATRYVGVILANHIVSAVDALVSARLRQLAGENIRLEPSPVRDQDGLRLDYQLRVRF